MATVPARTAARPRDSALPEPGLSSLPPGPRLPRPIQTLGFFKRHGPYMERCQARYGGVFTLRLADGLNPVMISDPGAIEQVFRGDPRVFHAGEGNRQLMHLSGETSVFQLDEEEHLALRKLVLPAFHGARIRGHEELMRELAAAEIARWPVGEPFALWPRMEEVTLEVIMQAIFGVDPGERFDRLRHLLERRALRRADEILFDEIRSRRGAPDLDQRDDVLSMLVQARFEDGAALSDQQVRDQLMTLLIAGHETTATALAWAVERLVRHPDKLEHLREEGRGEGEAYLEAVIRETLRLRPVIEHVLRRLTEPTELGGHQLPAGATLTPSIYLLHHRPEIYPEPKRFLPERFLEQSPGTYTWVPFGGGVRRCLGASFALLEAKKILKQIVATTRLRPVRPESERPIRRMATTRPEHDTEVLLEERLADAKVTA
jgi:cytochrome P450